MTPQDIITVARYIISDTGVGSTEYRQEDSELLLYVNEGLKECAIFRPEFFTRIGDVACQTGQCEQGIAFSDAVTLLEVISLHEGAALTKFDVKTMDAFNPGWRGDTPATPVQWATYPGDPLKFFLYPAVPQSGATVDVRYVTFPNDYALTDTITEVPNVLKPALVDYVVYRVSAKDDEYVGDGRAGAFYQSFMTKLKG